MGHGSVNVTVLRKILIPTVTVVHFCFGKRSKTNPGIDLEPYDVGSYKTVCIFCVIPFSPFWFSMFQIFPVFQVFSLKITL